MSAIKTILIADDSQTERLHLSQILQNAGYQVIVATSGNEARMLAETHNPDVIFLDIIMEDGDGYQTCRNLRRNPATAETPIIMVSSKSNQVDMQWAKKLGANHYVVKPYTPDAILTQLTAL
ncbi:MAG TPA: response regulator [Thiolinea sp.]|nr:response regulator [Thiolinea sp.]